MTANTKIKNQTEYINRVIEEDRKMAAKDPAYASYLQSLRDLVSLTNTVYENGGNLDKDSHKQLVEKYFEVAKKGYDYKGKNNSKTRANVVNHIHKLISKDLKVLNEMDKDNPGTLQAAFDDSRSYRVYIPEKLENKLGGEISERFPIVGKDGKKGFFTIRTDYAQEEKWNKLLDDVENWDITAEQKKKFRKLRTNQNLREELQFAVAAGDKVERYGTVASILGFHRDFEKAYEMLEQDKKLMDAIEKFYRESSKMVGAINFRERMGYDRYSRFDNKNVAMYDVAKLFGCEKLIAKSVPMVVASGDKVYKGTFMENAEGEDICRMKKDSLLRECDVEEAFYNKNLYKDLADLQMIDYICGNVDRHLGNVFYKTEKGAKDEIKIVGLVGIDNDASFPEDKVWKSELEREEGLTIYKPENFRFVSKQTAEIVKNITREQLETLLRGSNLSPKAIEGAWERTKEVQNVLKNMEKYNLSYTDDLDESMHPVANDETDPYYLTDEKPSIFSDLKTRFFEFRQKENNIALYKQNQRLKSKNERANSRLDLTEHTQFLKEQDKKLKPAESKKLSREDYLKEDFEKVKRMETLLKHVNRLKSATPEFAAMRDAMYLLATQSKTLSQKLSDSNSIDADDYNAYKQNLENLNAVTKAYIQAKGLTPKTAKGKERLESAMSIENRVEDLLESLEYSKKLEGMQKEDNVEEFAMDNHV